MIERYLYKVSETVVVPPAQLGTAIAGGRKDKDLGAVVAGGQSSKQLDHSVNNQMYTSTACEPRL